VQDSCPFHVRAAVFLCIASVLDICVHFPWLDMQHSAGHNPSCENADCGSCSTDTPAAGGYGYATQCLIRLPLVTGKCILPLPNGATPHWNHDSPCQDLHWIPGHLHSRTPPLMWSPTTISYACMLCIWWCRCIYRNI
jgi:hypothetical protein